jgi:5-methylcytosine-specific restriction endonuclease McrA
MRICSGAGCLRVVDDGIRFCDECKPQATTTTDDIRIHTLTDREKYAFLYSSSRWTRLRNLVIRSQPFCARCGNNISEIVDHIIPAGIAIVQASESGLYVDRYAGFFMRSNLHGLCRECHFKKTTEDKTHVGAWPSVVQADSLKAKRVWSFG